MSQLKQMQIRFSPLEDRLLLRISTADDAEFRFWLTRRYVVMLLPVLQQVLSSDPAVQSQDGEQQRRAVLSFQHESALAKADFDTEYEEGSLVLPLGDQPVLLSRLQVREDNGSHVLSFQPEQGQGVDLTFDVQLLHSFGKLLADAISQADWGLDIDGPGLSAPKNSTVRSGPLN